MSKPALHGRDFLTLADYTHAEISWLLERALALKAAPLADKVLTGLNLAMLFEKPSMRTRVSFEVGMNQLGGAGIVLSPEQVQLGQRETIADVAKVLSRYVDGIMIRTFAHSTADKLAEHADIPVINGLTDLVHPCQVMADLLTILEHKGKLEGLRLTYLGDGNNMAHSLMLGGAIMGLEVIVAAPSGYEPSLEIASLASELGKTTGGTVQISNDPIQASMGADILYTDVWASMGQESEAESRKQIFAPFQLNTKLMGKAQPDCLIMHCLPAHYGDEITDAAAHGVNSVIYDQAENRLHAQKAILAELLG